MKRSTKYTLKYLTESKKELLNKTFDIYGKYLQNTIDLMWKKKIPIKKWISTKDVTWMDDLGGQYKQLIYQQASEIVRSCIFKRRKSKPIVKNFCIDFTQNQIKCEMSNNSFDKWLKIRLPFINKNSKRKSERIQILIPLKEHKHSLKFKDWKQVKTIRISRTYAIFVFEKGEPKKKKNGKTLGIDIGYKNLIVTSEGQFIGKGFNNIYEKISRKQQGSKAFKRVLKERNIKINELINKELDLIDTKILKVENLKSVKKNSKGKIRKKFNNKLQRWCYPQVLRKLEMKSEEEAVQFIRVNPAYTSQTCPVCQFRNKDNRKGEVFICLNCGYKDHSDIVGALNISRQESIVPVAQGGI